jgi:two-component system, cell cycle sensor histidine kinase and response regulator CckA
VMPGMGGQDLAERLAALRRGMKVLYISGYTDRALMRQSVLPPRAAYLEKPFTPNALSEKVRDVLDGK